MHAVILRCTAATNGSDVCIVVSPISACMHVTIAARVVSATRRYLLYTGII